MFQSEGEKATYTLTSITNMNTSVARCIYTLLVVLLLNQSVCDAAPMPDYLPETNDMSDPDVQNLLVSQELKRQMLQNWPSQDNTENNSFDRMGFRRLIARQRLAAAAKKRTNGVALCLWKVCPAGPWLVSKK